MATIGETLSEARRRRGLSIEDVAHETHVRPNLIRSIEDDDFSAFPSVAYAKSFIRNYGDFLEVELESAMAALNSGVALPFGDHELAGEMQATMEKDRRMRFSPGRRARRRVEKPGGAPVFLNLVLAVLIGALLVFYFFGYDAETPDEAKTEIARGLNQANPFAEKVESEPAGDGGEGGDSGASGLPPNPLRAAGVESEANRAAAAGEPASDIEKPAVDWRVEEEAPRSLAGREGESGGLKARTLPGLSLEDPLTDLPPRFDLDLPEIEAADETADSDIEDPVPSSDDSEGEEAEPLRAVPVAASE